MRVEDNFTEDVELVWEQDRSVEREDFTQLGDGSNLVTHTVVSVSYDERNILGLINKVDEAIQDVDEKSTAESASLPSEKSTLETILENDEAQDAVEGVEDKSTLETILAKDERHDAVKGVEDKSTLEAMLAKDEGHDAVKGEEDKENEPRKTSFVSLAGAIQLDTKASIDTHTQYEKTSPPLTDDIGKEHSVLAHEVGSSDASVPVDGISASDAAGINSDQEKDITSSDDVDNSFFSVDMFPSEFRLQDMDAEEIIQEKISQTSPTTQSKACIQSESTLESMPTESAITYSRATDNVSAESESFYDSFISADEPDETEHVNSEETVKANVLSPASKDLYGEDSFDEETPDSEVNTHDEKSDGEVQGDKTNDINMDDTSKDLTLFASERSRINEIDPPTKSDYLDVKKDEKNTDIRIKDDSLLGVAGEREVNEDIREREDAVLDTEVSESSRRLNPKDDIQSFYQSCLNVNEADGKDPVEPEEEVKVNATSSDLNGKDPFDEGHKLDEKPDDGVLGDKKNDVNVIDTSKDNLVSVSERSRLNKMDPPTKSESLDVKKNEKSSDARIEDDLLLGTREREVNVDTRETEDPVLDTEVRESSRCLNAKEEVDTSSLSCLDTPALVTCVNSDGCNEAEKEQSVIPDSSEPIGLYHLGKEDAIQNKVETDTKTSTSALLDADAELAHKSSTIDPDEKLNSDQCPIVTAMPPNEGVFQETGETVSLNKEIYNGIPETHGAVEGIQKQVTNLEGLPGSVQFPVGMKDTGGEVGSKSETTLALPVSDESTPSKATLTSTGASSYQLSTVNTEHPFSARHPAIKPEWSTKQIELSSLSTASKIDTSRKLGAMMASEDYDHPTEFSMVSIEDVEAPATFTTPSKGGPLNKACESTNIFAQNLPDGTHRITGIPVGTAFPIDVAVNWDRNGSCVAGRNLEVETTPIARIRVKQRDEAARNLKSNIDENASFDYHGRCETEACKQHKQEPRSFNEKRASTDSVPYSDNLSASERSYQYASPSEIIQGNIAVSERALGNRSTTERKYGDISTSERTHMNGRTNRFLSASERVNLNPTISNRISKIPLRPDTGQLTESQLFALKRFGMIEDKENIDPIFSELQQSRSKPRNTTAPIARMRNSDVVRRNFVDVPVEDSCSHSDMLHDRYVKSARTGPRDGFFINDTADLFGVTATADLFDAAANADLFGMAATAKEFLGLDEKEPPPPPPPPTPPRPKKEPTGYRQNDVAGSIRKKEPAGYREIKVADDVSTHSRDSSFDSSCSRDDTFMSESVAAESFVCESVAVESVAAESVASSRNYPKKSKSWRNNRRTEEDPDSSIDTKDASFDSTSSEESAAGVVSFVLGAVWDLYGDEKSATESSGFGTMLNSVWDTAPNEKRKMKSRNQGLKTMAQKGKPKAQPLSSSLKGGSVNSTGTEARKKRVKFFDEGDAQSVFSETSGCRSTTKEDNFMDLDPLEYLEGFIETFHSEAFGDSAAATITPLPEKEDKTTDLLSGGCDIIQSKHIQEILSLFTDFQNMVSFQNSTTFFDEEEDKLNDSLDDSGTGSVQSSSSRHSKKIVQEKSFEDIIEKIREHNKEAANSTLHQGAYAPSQIKKTGSAKQGRPDIHPATFAHLREKAPRLYEMLRSKVSKNLGPANENIKTKTTQIETVANMPAKSLKEDSPTPGTTSNESPQSKRVSSEYAMAYAKISKQREIRGKRKNRTSTGNPGKSGGTSNGRNKGKSDSMVLDKTFVEALNTAQSWEIFNESPFRNTGPLQTIAEVEETFESDKSNLVVGGALEWGNSDTKNFLDSLAMMGEKKVSKVSKYLISSQNNVNMLLGNIQNNVEVFMGNNIIPSVPTGETSSTPKTIQIVQRTALPSCPQEKELQQNTSGHSCVKGVHTSATNITARERWVSGNVLESLAVGDEDSAVSFECMLLPKPGSNTSDKKEKKHTQTLEGIEEQSEHRTTKHSASRAEIILEDIQNSTKKIDTPLGNMKNDVEVAMKQNTSNIEKENKRDNPFKSNGSSNSQASRVTHNVNLDPVQSISEVEDADDGQSINSGGGSWAPGKFLETLGNQFVPEVIQLNDEELKQLRRRSAQMTMEGDEKLQPTPERAGARQLKRAHAENRKKKPSGEEKEAERPPHDNFLETLAKDSDVSKEPEGFLSSLAHDTDFDFGSFSEWDGKVEDWAPKDFMTWDDSSFVAIPGNDSSPSSVKGFMFEI